MVGRSADVKIVEESPFASITNDELNAKSVEEVKFVSME